MSLAHMLCCVAGCTSTIDPRWYTADADGQSVGACDGHGEIHGRHVYEIDPKRAAVYHAVVAERRRKAEVIKAAMAGEP